MKCPNCNKRMRVQNSRHNDDGTIYRIRHCLICGCRIGTIEKIDSAAIEDKGRGTRYVKQRISHP